MASGMDPTVLDTSPEALAVPRAIWRRMGPGGRLELALEMSDEVRAISVGGVLARNPEISHRDAVLEVTRRVLGDALYQAAFGRGPRGGR